MIGVVAILKVKDGEEGTFEAAMKEAIAAVGANEPGNLQYDMFKHKSEERTYVMMERYTDQAALDAHGQSAHFQKLFGALGGILDGPPALHMLDAVE